MIIGNYLIAIVDIQGMHCSIASRIKIHAGKVIANLKHNFIYMLKKWERSTEHSNE